MRVFIALVCLAAVASAGRLNITKCNGGEKGEISEVSVEEFADNAEVILKRGQTYDLTIKFKAGESSENLVPEIQGVIFGVPIQWHSLTGNACGSLTENKCPLVSGQEYSYSVSVPVLDLYPATRLHVRWSLVSADGNDKKGNRQICFIFPVRIIK